MAIERLHFAEGEMTYHSMHFADHLTRYGCLRSICAGKDILDVACGEGYGCYLLSKWGAASVTGIDVSSEAIAQAGSRFAADNISYLVGDVCQLEQLLSMGSKFDIICSFETIEHLGDPNIFLIALASFRQEGGVIVISAPNDSLLAADQSNPYHLRSYTYNSLKEGTEAVLGPATSWMLGVPIQGYTLVTEREPTSPDADFNIGLKGEDKGRLHLMPPQSNMNYDTDSALFWLGVWGDLPNDFSVAAPLSSRAFLEPWQRLERYKLANASKDSELRHLENIIAQERQAALEICGRLHELELNSTSIKFIAREVHRKMWNNVRWLPRKITIGIIRFCDADQKLHKLRSEGRWIEFVPHALYKGTRQGLEWLSLTMRNGISRFLKY